jgi:hypothetical protein
MGRTHFALAALCSIVMLTLLLLAMPETFDAHAAAAGASTAVRRDGDAVQPAPAETRRVEIRFGNVAGRHGNQLKAAVHAVELATRVAARLRARGGAVDVALLLPPVRQDGKWHRFSQLYDIAALRRRLAEVAVARAISVADDGDGDGDGNSRGEHAITCLEQDISFPRRGIPDRVPRPPPEAPPRCSPATATSAAHVQLTTRSFDAVVEAATAAVAAAPPQPASARLRVSRLYFYELIYYDDVADLSDAWAWLAPSAAVQLAVNAALGRHGLRPGDAARMAAAHLRGLEGSCRGRIAGMARRGKLPYALPPGAAAPTWQCDLGKAWAPLRRAAAGNATALLFLASDDVRVLRRLVAEQRASGDAAVTAVAFDDSVHGGVLGMVRDMWVCVAAADGFAGNVASTMSRAICHLRVARGTCCSGNDCRGVLRP